MIRYDNKEIPEGRDEIRLFMVGIDSGDFIPHLLRHYFGIGVDRVFYVDNDSSDNSLDVLSQYPNVHVWVQKEDFGGQHSPARSGVVWLRELMNRYGIDRWCLLADTDELFVYPGWRSRSLKAFVKEDLDGFDSVVGRFIDMYSSKKVKDTQVIDSFLETCPYFDRELHGCRRRVLGFVNNPIKMPFFVYRRWIRIHPGFHLIGGCRKVFDKCAVLHFKFTSRLPSLLAKHGHKMSDADKKMTVYAAIDEVSFYDPVVSQHYNKLEEVICGDNTEVRKWMEDHA